MGGPEAGNRAFRLGPDDGVLRVRVDDPADLLKLTKEAKMSRRVGGWPQVAVDGSTILQIHEDDVLRPELIVRHPTRLDGHDAGLAIDPTDIPPRKRDQSRLHDVEIGPPDRLLEFEGFHVSCA